MNIDPREWDLQERARQERARRELREDAAGTHDPALAGYFEVAQALRRSPGEPPADFAASVAALAAGDAAAAAAVAPTPAPALEARIERWLLRALAAVLVAACVAAVAIYGRDWAAGFDAIVPALGGASALDWVLAAAACMGVSWAFAKGAPQRGRATR